MIILTGVTHVPNVHSPWTDGSDVQTKVVLMRCRGESERMVFILTEI